MSYLKKTMVVVLSLMATTIYSQNLMDQKEDRFMLKVLNELPFLDIHGEAKYLINEDEVLHVDIKNKKSVDSESDRLSILNELPFLDTHGEAKYIDDKHEFVESSMVKVAEADEESLRLEILHELPFLDTHGEAKYIYD